MVAIDVAGTSAANYDGYEYDAESNPTPDRTRAEVLMLATYDALDRLQTRSVPANASSPAREL